MSGLPTPRCWRAISPSSICSIPRFPRRRELERRAPGSRSRGARASRASANPAARRPRPGIGGMVLVTSTGFHGTYLRSSQGISMTAISGEGTGMERDYDFSSAPHADDLASPDSVGKKAGERAVARVNPRKVETCKVPGGVRPARVGLAGRPSRRRHQRRLDRAQDQFPEGQARPAAVRRPTSASSTIPCGCAACARRPSTPRASG